MNKWKTDVTKIERGKAYLLKLLPPNSDTQIYAVGFKCNNCAGWHAAQCTPLADDTSFLMIVCADELVMGYMEMPK